MKSLLSLMILFVSFSLFGQDLIVKTDSTTIVGDIYRVNSTHIYFKYWGRGQLVDTYIKQENVSYYIMDYKKNPNYVDRGKLPTTIEDNSPDNQYKSSFTVGILQGGGSLIGFDFETLLYRTLGFQIGGGIVGYGAGLNIHFRPTVRSSFFSFQYWHQGIGRSYTQSVASANYVFRGKKWFTFQLGLGVPLEYGPNFPYNGKKSDVILTYAIGGYFPIGRY